MDLDRFGDRLGVTVGWIMVVIYVWLGGFLVVDTYWPQYTHEPAKISR